MTANTAPEAATQPDSDVDDPPDGKVAVTYVGHLGATQSLPDGQLIGRDATDDVPSTVHVDQALADRLAANPDFAVEREAGPGEQLPEVPDHTYQAGSIPLDLAPPARSENKDVHVEFAEALGLDVDGLTKDQVIDAYTAHLDKD